jgi:Ca-activated chloride channel homolog
LTVIPLLLPIVLAAAAQPYQISVNVDLVVLQATVHDGKGRLAPDLRAQDFAAYEDGVRQSIQVFRHEDIPVTVGLVVDHSGSMRSKLREVIAAAQTFVRASSPADEMFVVNFNEQVSLGLPAVMRFTNVADELARAISKAPTTGKTALYDAVVEAQVRLRGGRREKKVLIVISDGGDNASSHSLAEVLKIAGESNAVVYTIGIFDDQDADRNPAVLRRLARTTGGEAFFPKELTEVVAICDSIARDIRSQYTLGYLSSNPARPGAWRAIRMAAQTGGKGKLMVRTRSGYFAGESRPHKDEPSK